MPLVGLPWRAAAGKRRSVDEKCCEEAKGSDEQSRHGRVGRVHVRANATENARKSAFAVAESENAKSKNGTIVANETQRRNVTKRTGKRTDGGIENGRESARGFGRVELVVAVIGYPRAVAWTENASETLTGRIGCVTGLVGPVDSGNEKHLPFFCVFINRTNKTTFENVCRFYC